MWVTQEEKETRNTIFLCFIVFIIFLIVLMGVLTIKENIDIKEYESNLIKISKEVELINITAYTGGHIFHTIDDSGDFIKEYIPISDIKIENSNKKTKPTLILKGYEYKGKNIAKSNKVDYFDYAFYKEPSIELHISESDYTKFKINSN